MSLSPSQINKFLLFKLPSAFFCGVRVSSIDAQSCVTRVRLRWINQNPFRSMFWAVQGMAAELSTGALVMAAIRQSGEPISMLVLKNEASFVKKARGTIHFSCEDGVMITAAVQETLQNDKAVVCRLKSTGTDQKGNLVSEFYFEWTLKRKR